MGWTKTGTLTAPAVTGGELSIDPDDPGILIFTPAVNVAPTAPSSLAATPNQTSVAVTWSASADDDAVLGYQVRVGAGSWTDVGNVLGHTFTGLTPSTAYTFGVRAYDVEPLYSSEATVGSTTTSVPVNNPPTTPTGLAVTPTTTTAALTWSASTDDVAVPGYQVRVNGGAWTDVGNVLNHTFTGLSSGTAYTLGVRAYDVAPLYSAEATQGTTTLVPNAAPSAPSGLAVTPHPTTAVLTWAASTDDVAVVGYQVRVGAGAWTDVGNVLTYTFTSLTPSTAYTLGVRAYDAAPLYSSETTIGTTTPAANTAPTTPTGLAVTPHPTTAVLTWSASTDDAAVIGYQVRVGAGAWTDVGNVLTYTFTGLTPSTAYTLGVRAYDVEPLYSGEATASTTTLWSPSTLADKVAWFNADTLVGADATGIATWADQFGLHDVAQGSPTLRPTMETVHAARVARFAASPHRALISSTFTLVPQPITIALVAEFLTTPTAFNILLAGASVSEVKLSGNASAFWTVQAAAGAERVSDKLVSASAFQTVIVVFNGLSTTVRVDGVTYTVTATPGTGGLTVLNIASSLSTGFMGDLAELIVVNHVVTGTELTNLETYLNNKKAALT